MQTLEKKDQSTLRGGTDPIDGDGSGGNGGGGGSTSFGFCLENGIFVRVPCNSLCSNRTQPICGF
ncbi:hypothetical protein [Aquimarina sp. SS2-1]|uniref:hypothetical protein n=1 Tax=Aquimarina besae TaxID=3342247 RepID=UPI0036715E73